MKQRSARGVGAKSGRVQSWAFNRTEWRLVPAHRQSVGLSVGPVGKKKRAKIKRKLSGYSGPPDVHSDVWGTQFTKEVLCLWISRSLRVCLGFLFARSPFSFPFITTQVIVVFFVLVCRYHCWNLSANYGSCVVKFHSCKKNNATVILWYGRGGKKLAHSWHPFVPVELFKCAALLFTYVWAFLLIAVATKQVQHHGCAWLPTVWLLLFLV